MISLAKYLESAEQKHSGDPWTVEDNDAAIKRYETLRAESTTQKSATSAEDKIMDKTLKGLPVGWKVEKQVTGDVKIFMPSPDGWQEVDQDAFDALMLRLQGKGTSEEQMFPTAGNAKFPTEPVASAADGRGASEFLSATPYEDDEVGTNANIMVRMGNSYILPNVDPGIADPAPFQAPEPKDRTAVDGVTPPDFDDDDVVDVFANEDRDVRKHAIVKGRVRKSGLFSNLIRPEGTDGNSTGI